MKWGFGASRELYSGDTEPLRLAFKRPLARTMERRMKTSGNDHELGGK